MSRGHRRVGGGYDGGGNGADGDGQGAAAVAAAVVVQPVGVRLRRGPGGGELHWQSKQNWVNLIFKVHINLSPSLAQCVSFEVVYDRYRYATAAPESVDKYLLI